MTRRKGIDGQALQQFRDGARTILADLQPSLHNLGQSSGVPQAPEIPDRLLHSLNGMALFLSISFMKNLHRNLKDLLLAVQDSHNKPLLYGSPQRDQDPNEPTRALSCRQVNEERDPAGTAAS